MIKREKQKTNNEQELRSAAPDARPQNELPELGGAEAFLPNADSAPAGKAAKRSSRAQARGQGSDFLHGVKIFFIVVFILLLLLATGTTFAARYVSKLETTVPNLYIDNIYVGGMTRQQVDATLTSVGWNEKAADKLFVQLPLGIDFTVNYLDAGARTPREDAVNLVCSYGRHDNMFIDLFEYIKSSVTIVKLTTKVNISDDYIRACISPAAEKFKAATSDAEYKIDKQMSTLVFMKGAGEVTLDEEALFNDVKRALANGYKEFSFSKLSGTPTEPDFDALYDKLVVEPAEAYYTDTFEVVDEVNGCWFNIDRARELWESAPPLDYVYIPITLSYPEVTGEALRSQLFRDKLGEFTTEFPRSNENRISNIQLASSKIDGIILLPGETLSYNTTIGQRTEEAGFLRAGAYDNGKLVQELGGGICQVSSTLYAATIYAQLETLQRTSHYFQVDYMPIGMDATVSWPKPDYEFKNTREYPVKIVAHCDPVGKSLTVEIWGTNVDYSYVEFRHQTFTRYSQEIPDATIGYYVLGFRDVYDSDGNLIDTIAEPPSDYFFQ